MQPNTKIPADTRYEVPGLARGLSVLELLSREPGLGLSELSDRLDIPANTVYRIAKTLEGRGYLNRDPGSKGYRLTPLLFAIGSPAATGGTSLVEAAVEPMRQLRDETGETTLAGTLIGDEGVVLEQALGTHPFVFTVSIGLRFPLHTAAPGKAMLAALPEAEFEAILSRLELRKFTSRTITRPEDLREEIAISAKRGYGLDVGEEMEGQHCVGSAIRDARGRLAGAIWCTAPAVRLPRKNFHPLGQRMASAARDISRNLGYTELGVVA